MGLGPNESSHCGSGLLTKIQLIFKQHKIELAGDWFQLQEKLNQNFSGNCPQLGSHSLIL